MKKLLQLLAGYILFCIVMMPLLIMWDGVAALYGVPPIIISLIGCAMMGIFTVIGLDECLKVCGYKEGIIHARGE